MTVRRPSRASDLAGAASLSRSRRADCSQLIQGGHCLDLAMFNDGGQPAAQRRIDPSQAAVRPARACRRTLWSMT